MSTILSLSMCLQVLVIFSITLFQFWDCSTSYSSKMLFVTLQHQEIKESVTLVLNVQTWEDVWLEYALKDLEFVANVFYENNCSFII